MNGLVDEALAVHVGMSYLGHMSVGNHWASNQLGRGLPNLLKEVVGAEPVLPYVHPGKSAKQIVCHIFFIATAVGRSSGFIRRLVDDFFLEFTLLCCQSCCRTCSDIKAGSASIGSS